MISKNYPRVTQAFPVKGAVGFYVRTQALPVKGAFGFYVRTQALPVKGDVGFYVRSVYTGVFGTWGLRASKVTGHTDVLIQLL